MTSRSTRSTGAVASSAERGAPAGRGEHLVALAPEAAGEHVAVVLVVVHDQDHAAVRRPALGRGSRALRRPRPRARRGSPWPSSASSRSVAAQMRSRSASSAPAPASAARRRRPRPPRGRARGAGPACRARRRGPVRAALAARQHLVQQGQELARVGAQGGEAGGQLGLVAGRELLEQHLGVADDVVQRRAQLVAELRGGVDAHAPPLRPSRASIFSSSRARSTGLVSKSSQPAPCAFSRSPDMAWAVSAMTGIVLRRRSRLELAGRLPAVDAGQAHVHEDQAGASDRAIATPCSPSTAMTTS